MTKLKELEQQVKTDKNLPFRDEATNLVFGEGPENPTLMLIGEAPGKNEDLTGKPFIGSAGKILVELIESIGLTREEVYITSVIQYRPPKNRDPKPHEIALFQPYLDQQIKLLNPKIVVTLGRFSLSKFLPNEKIGEVHGKPQEIIWEGLKLIIIPMYHPAAIIYNQKLKQTLKEDFLIIKKYL